MNALNSFLIALLYVGITSVISTINVDTTSEWYICIKPDSMPDPKVFSIVWSLLYIIFLYILTVLLINFQKSKIAIIVLLILLSLCSVWVILYFGLKQANASLACIISILIFAIYFTFLLSKNRLGISPALMTPFLVWISFAIYLNYESYQKDVECE